MQNLLTNRHNTFVYRKQINQQDIRVSLRTKDKLEALRIIIELNYYVEFAQSKDPELVKRIIASALAKLQPQFAKERLSKLNMLLGQNLEPTYSEKLSILINQYMEEKIRSKAWSAKTFENNEAIFLSLPLLLGDKPIHHVTHRDAQNVKSMLQQLPSSMNKRAAYRDKTVKQILKLNIPENHLMSVKTINTRLGCYSELFKWAVNNGYAANNVFHGLVLKDRRKARELRLPFTPDDLNRIFKDTGITNPNKAWQYWLPVLGLYTGARLNELCQLRLNDIKNEAGIWYIDFTDEGEGQHLKSASSKRKVPIHKKLLEMGFIGFVEGAKQFNSQMLFDLPVRNARYSHTPSKWFNRIKSRALLEHEKKAFHSFRHTFIDYALNKLKLQGNPLLKAIVGHTDKEITTGIYGSSFELEDLNEVIQKIDFSALSVRIPPWTSQEH